MPLKRIQKEIPMYSACSGFGDALGKASRDMGAGRVVPAADVDPAAREETKRCHPDMILRDDCRRVTQEDIEENLVQVAHLAMPCDSFISASLQRGRKDEDTNLLEYREGIQRARVFCPELPIAGLPILHRF